MSDRMPDAELAEIELDLQGEDPWPEGEPWRRRCLSLFTEVRRARQGEQSWQLAAEQYLEQRKYWEVAADSNWKQWQTVDALKDEWGRRLLAAEAERDALRARAASAHA